MEAIHQGTLTPTICSIQRNVSTSVSLISLCPVFFHPRHHITCRNVCLVSTKCTSWCSVTVASVGMSASSTWLTSFRSICFFGSFPTLHLFLMILFGPGPHLHNHSMYAHYDTDRLVRDIKWINRNYLQYSYWRTKKMHLLAELQTRNVTVVSA